MDQKQLSAKIALDTFTGQVRRAGKVIDALTDEQLAGEISPGRNTGTYLLGHLTAVHDAMLPLLGIGHRAHPDLDEPFLKNPDKTDLPKPGITALRTAWKEVNDTLTSKLSALTPDQWYERHTAVSEEDFAKEPHRNRLNVVIGRAGHLAYHLGQLALLKS